MSAPSVLCATLEIALNRTLRLEPQVSAECAQLAGRCIALHVPNPGWTLFIEFINGGVIVLSARDAAADVTVSGPLTTLLRLSLQTAQGQSGLPTGLQVDGDTELLTRFTSMLARVGFDPEEVLAKYLGDGAAHRVAQTLKGLFGWGRKAGDTLLLDTAEYLREETRELARAEDAEGWMDEVDHMREGLDRLEARLHNLESRKATQESSP